MKVLVTGAGGMLGQALVREFYENRFDVVPLGRQELDVTDQARVAGAVQHFAPDAVVQCAAYTAVDDAEDNPETARRINAIAAGYVADACQSAGALFVYPSTDYVFSGNIDRPYRPEDPVAPLSAYGRSKAEGEAEARRIDRHLIVRTSWLYGEGGRNFVDTISRAAGSGRCLEIVDDQVGLPTWTGSLARVIARLLRIDAVGTFHAADSGPPTSWYGFAGEVFRSLGLGVESAPISTARYGARAPRPRFSVLDFSETEAVLGERLAPRAASLDRYLSGKTASRSLRLESSS